jgi:hypothetical protein
MCLQEQMAARPLGERPIRGGAFQGGEDSIRAAASVIGTGAGAYAITLVDASA